jgi:lipoate-protein ligase A
MLCIDSQNCNPYYNLAAEEIFLKQSDEDFFMVWESEPSVIIGKHQNTLSEINYRFISDNKVKVARRLTGGGTVYHDRGNINFSFIRNGEPGRLVDFHSFIEPVLLFLASHGVDSVQGPKHEIIACNGKISGNAEHVYKNRVLHHGTLLFDTDLEMLRRSIVHIGGTFTGKAVQSNRSHVINMVQCLPQIMDISEFRSALFNYVKSFFNGKVHEPDVMVKAQIQRLADEKYRSWEWIYGWSPDYSFKNEWKNDRFTIYIGLEVHKGMIENCSLECTELSLYAAAGLIKGNRHDEKNIRKSLEEAGLVAKMNLNDFESLVFSFL